MTAEFPADSLNTTTTRRVVVEEPAWVDTIPDPPGDFFLWGDALDRLSDLLAGWNQVLITSRLGADGLGKTCLARALAKRWQERYPRRLELDLYGASHSPAEPLKPEMGMRLVLAQLLPGQPLPVDSAGLAESYRQILASVPVLLLLDNVQDFDQVRALLPPAPSAAILTARAYFRLPSGPEPWLLEALPYPQARALLRAGLPVAGSPLLASAADEALDHLADLCDRLPLALRLAAGRMAQTASLTLEALQQELADERASLAARGKAVQPEVAVEACLNRLYQALPPDSQRHYRMLAVFPAPFDLRSAASVLEADPHQALPPGWVWRYDLPDDQQMIAVRVALDVLLELGLLAYDPRNDRYSLHDLARLDARQRLLAQEDEARLAMAAQACASLVQAAQSQRDDQLGGPIQVEAIYRFISLWPHLEAASRRLAAEELGWPEWVGAQRWLSDCADQLVALLELAVSPSQRIRVFSRAEAAAQPLGDLDAWARHLLNLGNALRDGGDPKGAQARYQQALSYYRQRPGLEGTHPLGEAVALNSLGKINLEMGEERLAVFYYRQAVTVCRDLGQRQRQAHAHLNLATAYQRLEAGQQALEHCQEAHSIFSEAGDSLMTAQALTTWGYVLLDLGWPHLAAQHLLQALEIFQRLGEQPGQARALTGLGNAYLSLADARPALSYLQRALAFHRARRDLTAEGLVLASLGLALAYLGRIEEAMGYFGAGLEIYQKLGSARGEGLVIGNRALAQHHWGHITQAIEDYEYRLGLAERIGDRRSQARTRFSLAEIYHEAGQDALASQNYEQALKLFRRLGDLRGQGQATIGLAMIAFDRGHTPEAERHYQDALNMALQGGEARLEGLARVGLAWIDFQRGQVDAAAENFAAALQIANALGDRRLTAQALDGQGAIARQQKDLDGAIFYFEQSLGLARQLGDRRRGAAALEQLAKVYGQRQNPERCIYCYEHALEAYRWLGNRRKERQTLRRLAWAHLLRGRLELAGQYAAQWAGLIG